MPTRWLSVYSPTNGASVPACRSTAYSSGVNSARHCASVFSTAAGGISSVVSMPLTVLISMRRSIEAVRPTVARLQQVRDAGDAEHDRGCGADQDEPDDQFRGRAPGAGEPGEAVSEGGDVLQLAV